MSSSSSSSSLRSIDVVFKRRMTWLVSDAVRWEAEIIAMKRQGIVRIRQIAAMKYFVNWLLRELTLPFVSFDFTKLTPFKGMPPFNQFPEKGCEIAIKGFNKEEDKVVFTINVHSGGFLVDRRYTYKDFKGWPFPTGIGSDDAPLAPGVAITTSIKGLLTTFLWLFKLARNGIIVVHRSSYPAQSRSMRLPLGQTRIDGPVASLPLETSRLGEIVATLQIDPETTSLQDLDDAIDDEDEYERLRRQQMVADKKEFELKEREAAREKRRLERERNTDPYFQDENNKKRERDEREADKDQKELNRLVQQEGMEAAEIKKYQKEMDVKVNRAKDEFSRLLEEKLAKHKFIKFGFRSLHQIPCAIMVVLSKIPDEWASQSVSTRIERKKRRSSEEGEEDDDLTQEIKRLSQSQSQNRLDRLGKGAYWYTYQAFNDTGYEEMADMDEISKRLESFSGLKWVDRIDESGYDRPPATYANIESLIRYLFLHYPDNPSVVYSDASGYDFPRKEDFLPFDDQLEFLLPADRYLAAFESEDDDDELSESQKKGKEAYRSTHPQLSSDEKKQLAHIFNPFRFSVIDYSRLLALKYPKRDDTDKVGRDEGKEEEKKKKKAPRRGRKISDDEEEEEGDDDNRGGSGGGGGGGPGSDHDDDDDDDRETKQQRLSEGKTKIISSVDEVYQPPPQAKEYEEAESNTTKESGVYGVTKEDRTSWLAYGRRRIETYLMFKNDDGTEPRKFWSLPIEENGKAITKGPPRVATMKFSAHEEEDDEARDTDRIRWNTCMALLGHPPSEYMNLINDARVVLYRTEESGEDKSETRAEGIWVYDPPVSKKGQLILYPKLITHLKTSLNRALAYLRDVQREAADIIQKKGLTSTPVEKMLGPLRTIMGAQRVDHFELGFGKSYAANPIGRRPAPGGSLHQHVLGSSRMARCVYILNWSAKQRGTTSIHQVPDPWPADNFPDGQILRAFMSPIDYTNHYSIDAQTNRTNVQWTQKINRMLVFPEWFYNITRLLVWGRTFESVKDIGDEVTAANRCSHLSPLLPGFFMRPIQTNKKMATAKTTIFTVHETFAQLMRLLHRQKTRPSPAPMIYLVILVMDEMYRQLVASICTQGSTSYDGSDLVPFILHWDSIRVELRDSNKELIPPLAELFADANAPAENKAMTDEFTTTCNTYYSDEITKQVGIWWAQEAETKETIENEDSWYPKKAEMDMKVPASAEPDEDDPNIPLEWLIWKNSTRLYAMAAEATTSHKKKKKSDKLDEQKKRDEKNARRRQIAAQKRAAEKEAKEETKQKPGEDDAAWAKRLRLKKRSKESPTGGSDDEAEKEANEPPSKKEKKKPPTKKAQTEKKKRKTRVSKKDSGDSKRGGGGGDDDDSGTKKQKIVPVVVVSPGQIEVKQKPVRSHPPPTEEDVSIVFDRKHPAEIGKHSLSLETREMMGNTGVSISDPQSIVDIPGMMRSRFDFSIQEDDPSPELILQRKQAAGCAAMDYNTAVVFSARPGKDEDMWAIGSPNDVFPDSYESFISEPLREGSKYAIISVKIDAEEREDQPNIVNIIKAILHLLLRSNRLGRVDVTVEELWEVVTEDVVYTYQYDRQLLPRRESIPVTPIRKPSLDRHGREIVIIEDSPETVAPKAAPPLTVEQQLAVYQRWLAELQRRVRTESQLAAREYADTIDREIERMNSTTISSTPSRPSLSSPSRSPVVFVESTPSPPPPPPPRRSPSSSPIPQLAGLSNLPSLLSPDRPPQPTSEAEQLLEVQWYRSKIIKAYGEAKRLIISNNAKIPPSSSSSSSSTPTRYRYIEPPEWVRFREYSSLLSSSSSSSSSSNLKEIVEWHRDLLASTIRKCNEAIDSMNQLEIAQRGSSARLLQFLAVPVYDPTSLPSIPSTSGRPDYHDNLPAKPLHQPQQKAKRAISTDHQNDDSAWWTKPAANGWSIKDMEQSTGGQQTKSGVYYY